MLKYSNIRYWTGQSSLSQAMMGMEDEVSLYSLDDLKEINK